MDLARLGFPLAIAAALLGATVARAESGQTVVVHPLVLLGADASESSELDGLLKLEVARTTWDLVNHDPVRPFLARHEGASCAGDDACLGALAKATGAHASLLVSVSPAGPRVMVSGRVVRADGVTLRTIRAREFKRSGRDLKTVGTEAFRALVPELLPELDPVDLEPLITLDKPAENPKTAARPVPPVEAPAAKAPFPGRTVGLVIGGVGAATLAVSGVVALTSMADHEELKQALTDQGFRPESNARARQLEQSLRTRSEISTWTLVGGAALTAAGAAMFLLSPPPEKPSISVGPGPTGAGLSIFGNF